MRRQVRASAAHLGGRAPPGVARLWVGVGRGCLSVVACPCCVCALVPVVAPSPSVPRPLVLSPSWPFDGFLPLHCVAPGALSLWAPACYLGPPLAPLPGCPFPSLALPLPLPFPFPVWCCWGGGGGLWGADGTCLEVGGLQPPTEGFNGVWGGEGPGPRPGGGLPMPPAAWRPQGQPRSGWRGCGCGSP